ncbi:non-homologous end-joining DNA ligase [Streptomyces lonarensis]|uniref:ATP-dependent DNA ligase n=1 Tax=Streptomyces lonarensis TaxID=700599 RepID=A0A7X6D2F9_9ACTN|nr:non-homologous end-joining DNA ligase [Streptomyces lonarensis]NJQ06889.1 ATP-dependent DNA ligase [Streptomyces lonarensis]
MTVTEVEGRRLTLTNLDKVIHPATGTTKGELVHHYAVNAGTLLPHLHDRPLSFLRYPDGPGGQRFFTKNVPPGTPGWVKSSEVPRHGDAPARQVLVQDLPSLVWAANLVVEFHTPQWRATEPEQADRLVLDLDPGSPATVVECCVLARWLRDRLAEDGLASYVKTSGSKGLHLLCPLVPAPAAEVSAYARSLAELAAAELPELAVAVMRRAARPGKVFVDWSQNAAAKTTAAPYTLRARESPEVSTPVTWEEVAGCADPRELAFTLADVPDRIAAHGDLLGGLLNAARARPLPAVRRPRA